MKQEHIEYIIKDPPHTGNRYRMLIQEDLIPDHRNAVDLEAGNDKGKNSQTLIQEGLNHSHTNALRNNTTSPKGETKQSTILQVLFSYRASQLAQHGLHSN